MDALYLIRTEKYLTLSNMYRWLTVGSWLHWLSQSFSWSENTLLISPILCLFSFLGNLAVKVVTNHIKMAEVKEAKLTFTSGN
jgi:hypothetical protein